MDERAVESTRELERKLAEAYPDEDYWYRQDVIAAVNKRVVDYTRELNRLSPTGPWHVSIWAHLVNRNIGVHGPPDDFWAVCQGNVYKCIGLKGWYVLTEAVRKAAEEHGDNPPDQPDFPTWLLGELGIS